MLETGQQWEISELRKLFKLQLEASRVLSRQLGTQELIESLLALICRSLNWQVGRFWTRSSGNANQLNCQAIWHSSDATVSDCDQQKIAKVWDAPQTKAGQPTILKKEASVSSIAIP